VLGDGTKLAVFLNKIVSREEREMKVTTPDIDTVLEKYPGEPKYLISLMQDVQSLYNYISPEHMDLICTHVGVPRTRVWSVATFYKSFSLEPRGEHEIKVCLGTACHLKGSPRIVESLERELHVCRGHTTGDLRFTLDTVNCVGACAMAPVVVVDEEYQPRTTFRKLNRLLKRIAE
jgi:NADH-quinone oxidoreductase subunit E